MNRPHPEEIGEIWSHHRYGFGASWGNVQRLFDEINHLQAENADLKRQIEVLEQLYVEPDK